MNGRDLLKELNDIDGEMLREAEPSGTETVGRKVDRARIFRWAGLSAAVLLLVVGLGIWLGQKLSLIHI